MTRSRRRIDALPLLSVLLLAIASQTSAQRPAPRTTPLPPPNATLATEFTLVSAVRELADGSLLVVDQADKKLLVADWTSGTAVQLGTNGRGPGEYSQPSILFALGGDSTLLPDVSNGRWLVLHGASVAGTIGPDSPPIAAGARRPLGADALGRVIFTRGLDAVSVGSGSMPRLDSLRLMRVARADGQADTLAVISARKAKVTMQGPRERPTSVEVFTNPLAAGEQAVLFMDGWVAIARVDPYRVDWIAPDGRRIRGEALPFEVVEVNDREKRVFVDRWAERSGAPVRDPASMPDWPESMPPFLTGALLPAPDGRLWIRRTATAANASPPYDIVDRAGRLVGRASVDANVHLVGFGRNAVYTVVTDDNGIQRIQRRAVLP